MTLVEVSDLFTAKIFKIVHLKDKITAVDTVRIYKYMTSRVNMKSQNFKMGFEYLPNNYESFEDIDSMKFIYQCCKPSQEDFDEEDVQSQLNILDDSDNKRKERYTTHYNGRMLCYYEQYIRKHINEKEFSKEINLLDKYKNKLSLVNMRSLCEDIIRKKKGDEIKNKYSTLEKKANTYFNENEY